jgi:non-specific serine/threonine protein kinase
MSRPLPERARKKLRLGGEPAPGVAISLERECLLRGGHEIRLRAKTFQVLAHLHEHRGRLVTKEDLFRAVWPDTFVSDDSLTKCVREIRDALGDRQRQLLKTVARRGFILDASLPTAGQEGVQRPQRREPSAPPPHNLPSPLSSFIGRRREIAELAQLLPSARLLTLTGTGGCGKTRLALEVARQVLDRFPDGAWRADLAPLGEPALVAQTVASVLDVRQAPGRTLVESLADQLRQRRTLVLLDNCEHVVAAAAELAHALLGAVDGLTILATSREALGITGETTWLVPPLTVPDTPYSGGSDELLWYESVRLLAERGAAVDSGFAITNDNARAVAEVCRRLDGIPLAIELAAARLRVLSIEQINARLDERFRLLIRSERTTIGRQRTLEATVDWSYDLLTGPERVVLSRLSVFAGGWTLEAAEHTCAGGGIATSDVLEVMARLIDKSLVMADAEVGGERRYRFLETVRQYAGERLEQTGGGDAVRRRHFEFFLDLALRVEPELVKEDQLLWLAHLQREHDNLRTALEWRLTSEQPDPDSLQLALALYWFWMKRAHLPEGQQYLERALARCPDGEPMRRAQAVAGLGSIIFFLGDFERAERLLEESAALADAAGDPATAALALGIGTMAAMERGDPGNAARRAAASAAAARAAGAPWLEGFSLSYEAYEALSAGDVDRAGVLHERALAVLRAQGDLWGMGIVLFDLALLRLVQRRHQEARALCGEAIALGRQFGDRRAVAWSLGILAGADAAEGQWVRAARLRGAMEGLLESIGSSVQPTYNAWIGDPLLAAVQQELGIDTCQQAMAAGRDMSLSQAIEYATSGQDRLENSGR